jgi:tetratricopeptide (TPR) repeat protein
MYTGRVADVSPLDDLRRRVQRDPASLVFANLAEECRRAGAVDEAIRVCRAGLLHHPEYLSARVTLGLALLARGEFDAAQAELVLVLGIAPENLAARRALTEIRRLRGDEPGARELQTRGGTSLLLAAGQHTPDPILVPASPPAIEPPLELGPAADHVPLQRLEAWLHAIRARQQALRRSGGSAS